MPEAESRNLTELLHAWSEGDVQAPHYYEVDCIRMVSEALHQLQAGELPSSRGAVPERIENIR